MGKLVEPRHTPSTRARSRSTSSVASGSGTPSPALIVLLALSGSAAGPQLRHRVRGRRRVPASRCSRPGHPGQRRQDPRRGRAGGAGRRHPGRRVADREHLRPGQHPGPDRAARPTTRPTRSRRRSRTTVGVADRRQPATRSARPGAPRSPSARCSASCVFLVLVVLFIWAYFREWKMSVGAIVALAHDLLITVGVYALSGLRGHAGHGDRHPDDPRASRSTTPSWCSTRSGRTPRTSRAPGRPTPRPPTWRSTRPWSGRSTPRSWRCCRSARCCTSASCQLGSGALKDLALALFVGMAAGAYSSIFIATPLLVQLKELEPAIKAGDARAMRHRDRKTVDPYAAVPAFTEDMPLQDEPGADGRARPPRPTASAVAAAAPSAAAARLHGRASGRPRGRCASSASAKRAQPTPQAALPAGQEVTVARRRRPRRALERLVRDVPDFPEPGVVFKDITPLLADHDGVHRGGRARWPRPAATRRRRSWSTRSSAWRRAGSSSPRRSRWRSAPGSCRCARPASCRGETHAVSYALEYGEATLEMHRDAHRAGRAGAARRRRAGHRRHRRRRPAGWSSAAAAPCTRSPC